MCLSCDDIPPRRSKEKANVVYTHCMANGGSICVLLAGFEERTDQPTKNERRKKKSFGEREWDEFLNTNAMFAQFYACCRVPHVLFGTWNVDETRVTQNELQKNKEENSLSDAVKNIFRLLRLLPFFRFFGKQYFRVSAFVSFTVAHTRDCWLPHTAMGERRFFFYFAFLLFSVVQSIVQFWPNNDFALFVAVHSRRQSSQTIH